MSPPLLICSAFAAGAVGLHLARTLPQAPFWALVLGAVGVGVTVRGRWLVPAAVCGGLAWSAVHATLALDHRLDAPREATVDAVITDLVQHGERSTRFMVRFPRPAEAGGVRRAQLIWYGVTRPPAEGEYWRFDLALRPPGGRLNPGGFDRERWLVTRRLDATGTVADGHQLAAPGPGLDRVRAGLSRQLRAAVNHDQAGAMLAALAVGDRRFLNDRTWDALLHTGTNHLVAISGLHVGLAGGLGLLLGTGGWRLLGGAAARVPAPVAGAVVGLLTAATYAALAGFTIPTQRALLMLAVVLMAVAARRPVRPLYLFLVALTGVLLIDPLAPLASGFWLSFAAVACLGLLLRGTPGTPAPWRWPALQLQLGVAIVPLTLALFGHAAVLAPLANLVAIPLVGLFAVPLTLMASALVVIAPETGTFVAGLAAWVLWLFLAFVDGLHNAAAGLPRPGVPEAPLAWLLLAACSLIVLLPGAVAPRLLALPFAAAALAATQDGGVPGEWRTTVLDVGHGHATVLETPGGVVVVDAGRRGEAVNALLARRAPGGADGLVLTRDRVGHRGGAERVQLTPGAWRTSAGGDEGRCRGTPGPHGQERSHLRFIDDPLARDACLVLVRGPSASLLLATGVEPGQAIRWESLPSVDAVVLPAGGHRDAVTPAMLDALAPEVAIVPVDAGNRHGLPHAETLARLERRDVDIHITGRDGAVELVARDGLQVSPRRQQAGWWNRP